MSAGRGVVGGTKNRSICGRYPASRFIRQKGRISFLLYPMPYAVKGKEDFFMQKTTKGKRRIAIFGTLAVMVASSLLAAMSIVLGKYLAIGVGNVLRFSFENLPIMLAGMLFGPIIGAAVALVADLVGCILVGYAVNPVVTVGAVAIGAISGAAYHLLKKRLAIGHGLCVSLSVIAAHAVGSVLIKTPGLAMFYDMPMGMLFLYRLLNYAIVGSVETVLLYFITKNKAVCSSLERIKR